MKLIQVKELENLKEAVMQSDSKDGAKEKFDPEKHIPCNTVNNRVRQTYM